jgi:type I restriction enzyme R subunit
MTYVGAKEKVTQDRIIALFKELGYAYLGDWHYKSDNSNIDVDRLTTYLTGAGYVPDQINAAVYQLKSAAVVPTSGDQTVLTAANEAVWKLLRYGVDVKTAPDTPTAKVKLINWAEPHLNDFGIAEEVTLKGNNTRRPDLVLYVNGIALGVIELKSSVESISKGIGQSISNQTPAFHRWFYSTVQFLFAGSDSEGLAYGTTTTPEKFWLRWKEDVHDQSELQIDKYLRRMCNKARFLELIYDFVLFDGGVKKVPRVHQYFGVKAARGRIEAGEGGVIWHTQGSGKSIVMVLLARWILENNPNARVAVITDRETLDKQIAGVFTNAGETIERARSGNHLMTLLSTSKTRLLCSLVHKFGRREAKQLEATLAAIQVNPPSIAGDLFVFVDECHRTQTGTFNKLMKAMLPDAIFIGFTGTPLLKKDRRNTRQVFGRPIHTYKFNEAVQDEVVLDLVYEARDIEQRLGDPKKIDTWFKASAGDLTTHQQAMLREHWATLQKVRSSGSRMAKIVHDITYDFKVRPRLTAERGTAMLVASSIYEACRYYRLFRQTSLKNKCAVVTSYDPRASDITSEDTGADTETAKELIYDTYVELLADIQPKPGKTKTEVYEDGVKKRFQEQPATMKLLIVVDKLLTGFDAPTCSYLYLDKSMQDHGLFQAICRTNRLDGAGKDYGYIVDYKDLFKKVNKAITVYTSDLDDTDDADPGIELKDRIAEARKRLDDALEDFEQRCAPVPPPQQMLEHQRYFCGNVEVPAEAADRRPMRELLYQSVARLVRAFANLEYELLDAGYTQGEATAIRAQVKWAVKLRAAIRLAAGETLNLKAYEADMRMLIDTYIKAEDSKKLTDFEQTPLLEVLTRLGVDAAIQAVQEETDGDLETVAETIAHNVRSVIVKGQLTDPAYYAKMSSILDTLISELREKRKSYKAFLEGVAELAKKVEKGVDDGVPAYINTDGLKALYNCLEQDPERALAVHTAIMQERPDDWRSTRIKRRMLMAAINDVVQDAGEAAKVYAIVDKNPEY